MESDTQRESGEGIAPYVANLGIMRPPLVYLCAIGLGVPLYLVWPVRLMLRSVGLPLGVIAVLVAAALFVYAARTFRTAGTPVPGNRPTTTIVRPGPYRWTRNPIYLAFSLFQLGIALCVNSPRPLIDSLQGTLRTTSSC